jgi:NADPH:quinone reductase-like Zn-dependent oxidoreductase
MKAIVYTEYGPPDVLQLKEVAKPTPKDNEILVKVQATTVNYGDTVARNFKNIPYSEFNMPMPIMLPARFVFGLRKPKNPILGSEFAGEIEATGKDARQFKKGDPVYGYLGQGMGAYAEYVCMPEAGQVAFKPANMSYAEAAAVPYGAIMAASLLRKVNLQHGQKVLIIGASGAIGSAALQLAKQYYGAEVTGVGGTPRLELLQTLGADRVIDYTKEDFTQSGETYDLIFDVLGRGSFARCKKVLKRNGRYLLASFKTKQIFQMWWTSIIGSQKVICGLAAEQAEDLGFVKELAEAGRYKSVVDRCYPLEQAAEAHRYVETGQKKGNVVITVAQKDKG